VEETSCGRVEVAVAAGVAAGGVVADGVVGAGA
jgi:hypothetical protein